MSDLVDKINEMIDILHEIDPVAATKFRSGSRDQQAKISDPIERVQSLPPIRPDKIINGQSKTNMNVDNKFKSSLRVTDFSTIKLKAENLIEGVVFSEIIGKPISKRHGKRQF